MPLRFGSPFPDEDPYPWFSSDETARRGGVRLDARRGADRSRATPAWDAGLSATDVIALGARDYTEGRVDVSTSARTIDAA